VAEIPIERKPRHKFGVLLLVVLLIVAAAVGWFWWSAKVTASPATGMGTSPVRTVTFANAIRLESV
jgi:multidrug resistance efflux pump